MPQEQEVAVAIIIPIYNVEKYLKECLDSVLNQTYRNLQIILIDDASTDTSFSIAKEYFNKDLRITLMRSKENLGMGATRNAGLNYFQSLRIAQQKANKEASSFASKGGGDRENYKHNENDPKQLILSPNLDPSLAHAIQDLIPSLAEFHSHNINQTLPSYIHFLDSDDCLSLTCISTCVQLAHQFQAEIIWHGCMLLEQASQKRTPSMTLSQLKLEENRPYRGVEIFKSLPKPPSFSWSTNGMIDFDFLNRFSLSFFNGIESEDALFGTQLFSLAQRIIIYHQKDYIYRIHPNSISASSLTKETKEMKFPRFLNDVFQSFKTPYEVRHYSFAYSHCFICLQLDQFLQTHAQILDQETKELIIEMIEYRAIYAFGALSFKSDPRNCRAICQKLLPYSSKIRFASKIAYHFPKLFKALKAIQEKICKK